MSKANSQIAKRKSDKKERIKQMKRCYKLICNLYVKEFVKKHKYQFSYWVSGDIGIVACFIEQYFFSMDEIRYDIDNNCKKGLIFEWQDYLLDNQKEECRINYSSYSKGARY